MDNRKFQLSLEQEFHICALEVSTDYLSREELQAAVVNFTRQLMVKENVIQHLIEAATHCEATPST
ncbi:NblA/ycf18 family protein [filamentous cyanobacterium LEGE 11480]|uniref:NblA/ycf18 family protein n=1 Tax=Romeriopsis navalis LEGE 11480 TaxID=2777977 RepID=A0A928Z5F7_9CYAN|nr:NblA/ycf18 family protein [Romeriopsis navalis]MBE9031428.1 NblA/ycf18 family protein [Romeriopsis navalis LEGE 11480]